MHLLIYPGCFFCLFFVSSKKAGFYNFYFYYFFRFWKILTVADLTHFSLKTQCLNIFSQNYFWNQIAKCNLNVFDLSVKLKSSETKRERSPSKEFIETSTLPLCGPMEGGGIVPVRKKRKRKRCFDGGKRGYDRPFDRRASNLRPNLTSNTLVAVVSDEDHTCARPPAWCLLDSLRNESLINCVPYIGLTFSWFIKIATAF